MRPELRALLAVVRLGRGREAGDLDRVGRLAHIEYPAALDAVGAIVEIALIGEHRQVAVGQWQRRMGAAAERRAPVAVRPQLPPGGVADGVDRHAALAPS